MKTSKETNSHTAVRNLFKQCSHQRKHTYMQFVASAQRNIIQAPIWRILTKNYWYNQYWPKKHNSIPNQYYRVQNYHRLAATSLTKLNCAHCSRSAYPTVSTVTWEHRPPCTRSCWENFVDEPWRYLSMTHDDHAMPSTPCAFATRLATGLTTRLATGFALASCTGGTIPFGRSFS